MASKSKLDQQDIDLFREAVGDVKPVKTDRVIHNHSRPRPKPRFSQISARAILHESLNGTVEPDEFDTGEELLFLRPGMQRNILRKLRRGQFSVHAELDLHGMTVATARTAVRRFLHQCAESGIRCVRIIHGKGRGSWQKEPVLKHKVNLWLRRLDAVLGFCSARQVDGGTGAVYVLLKSRN